MEEQLAGLEILLNMYVSSPPYPCQNTMTVVKAAPKICQTCRMDGMSMSGCVNVFSQLDRHFSSVANALFVCKMKSLFLMLHQEAVGTQWEPTPVWKTRLALGRKPQNIELIFVKKIIFLWFVYQLVKYPETEVGRQHIRKTELK